MKKLHRGGSNPDGEPLSAGRVEYLEAARQRVRRRRLRRTAILLAALILVTLFATGAVGASIARVKDMVDTVHIALSPAVGWPQQTGLGELTAVQPMSGSFVAMDEDACAYLAESAGGDLRKALGCLDFAVTAAPIEDGEKHITLEMIQQVTRRTAMRYDREGDDHYDIVSAYQKSMRGSDPDAALHYLARLLEAGDLPSACRRLMVCACEDVGLAYPQIIPIVKAAIDAANMVGLPEARLPLADAVILVATSPKSNSAHDAINAAIADVQAGRTGPIPRQLQNKHYDGEDALVKGQNYKYAHDYAHHWVEQQYLPDAIKDVKYYTFGDNKNEQAARAYWAKIKGEENV